MSPRAGAGRTAAGPWTEAAGQGQGARYSVPRKGCFFGVDGSLAEAGVKGTGEGRNRKTGPSAPRGRKKTRS